MTEYAGSLSQQQRRNDLSRLQRSAWFVLFLACGLLVFVVFSHYYPIFNGSLDLYGRIGVTLFFLIAALLARSSHRLHRYWQMLFAFGTACAAISVDYLLGLSKWLLPALNIGAETPAGWAIDKLESSLLSVVVILALTLASRQSLASLYLRRGRLWLGLVVGLAVFVVMVATAIPLAELQFGGSNLSWQRILPWTPWVLIFILANAFNEELLFRGLFLGRLEPFMGKFAANLLMAIPFTLMHTGANYTPDVLLFLGMLFPLSLAWGWLMQKTDSIWGSVLFHAAMDIPIVLGIFSSLS
ncbi:MAG TPA: CPBP family intramembrane glutamic endopeptidase [Anaerolineae bacterium]|nr:CPBP family intramembrane glutamic endopeptidase [Anaerolineae bacterium]